jgi:hypothetical protein
MKKCFEYDIDAATSWTSSRLSLENLQHVYNGYYPLFDEVNRFKS